MTAASYDQLREQLKEAESIIHALTTGQADALVTEKGVRVLRLHKTEQTLRDAVESLDRLLVDRTRELEQLKSAEAALRDSEARLKKGEGLAGVGHWHRDLKSDELSWSEGMFQIFGQPPDFVPSFDNFLQALAPGDGERVQNTIRQTIAENTENTLEYRLEFQIVRPDGELRTVRSFSEIQRDEDGQPRHAFGAVQDITALRRAQEENLARQKLESVGTLANGIAHDFNNLLGGVLAQAELALSELEAGSAPYDEIKRIRGAAISGAEIVRQLMIYAGKEDAVSGSTDVSWVVKEMIELLKVSVSKHVVIESDLAQGLPAVQANSAQLRQIVMNLVTNASEAIGERDGVICVTTKLVKVAEAASEASSNRGTSFVQLEVSDTGPGMALETRARIFDPFFTTKSTGHGLGLAVVQGIVRSLRGTIHLDSEAGRGTRFRVLVPCSEEKTKTSANAAAETRPPVGSVAATVLVAEDWEDLRKAVVMVLRKAGFEVLEAADGSAAIDILRRKEHEIHLMLLDMTMPGAPSLEIVAEVEKSRPDTRIILTSAYSQEVVMDGMIEGQIYGFIRKPFQMANLLQMLRDILSAAKTSRI
jgi:PAS domain S-box-containing protein